MSLLTAFLSKKTFMAGLDVGFNSVKIATLKEHAGALSVESVGYCRLSNDHARDEETQRGLKEVLRNFHLKGRAVSCSISHNELAVRYFNLPGMSAAEVKEAIVWEAPKHLPFPLKDSVYDYVVVDEGGGSGGGILVMIAAIPERTVNAWLKIITRTGVSIGAVDAAGMALLAYFDLVHGWEEGKSKAVLNLGYRFTGINIFKEARLRLTRDIGIAGENMDQSISEHTGLNLDQSAQIKHVSGFENITGSSEQEELAAKARMALEQTAEKIIVEAQRSFDFYSSQYREPPIDHLYITGGGALIPGLAGYFEKLLNMPVTIEDPFESMPLDKQLEKDETLMKMGPFFTVAVGLATRRSS